MSNVNHLHSLQAASNLHCPAFPLLRPILWPTKNADNSLITAGAGLLVQPDDFEHFEVRTTTHRLRSLPFVALTMK